MPDIYFIPKGIRAPRRMKTVRVAADALLAFFRALDGNSFVRCNGLPNDAKVVGISIQYQNRLLIAIESEEFPETPEGFEPEELSLLFHTFTPGPDVPRSF